MKKLLSQMTCCSWHTPRNAVVFKKTGDAVPKEVLDSIPDGRAKEDMIYSGNVCNPCMKRLWAGREQPLLENLIGAASESG